MPMMPPRADRDARRANVLERAQAVVVGARRDDRPVVLAARVEVVVVRVEARLLEACGLRLGEHAERHARLEPERLHARAPSRARDRTPGRPSPRATRRPCRSASSRSSWRARAAASTSSTSSIFSAPDVGLVVARLRAVRAVLGAAAGLHAEQRAELHFAGRRGGCGGRRAPRRGGRREGGRRGRARWRARTQTQQWSSSSSLPPAI